MDLESKLDLFRSEIIDLINKWSFDCTKKYLKRVSKITMKKFLATMINLDINSGINLAITKIQETFSNSAFTHFRAKIDNEACEDIFKSLLNLFKNHDMLPKGALIVAADGSTLTLDSCLKDMGFRSDTEGGLVVGLLTVLIDLETQIPIEVDFSENKNERDALLRLVKRLPKGSLIIMDRGYSGVDFVTQIRSLGYDIICRLPKHLSIVKGRQKKSNDQDVMVGSVKMRLISYLTPENGFEAGDNIINLVTSLDRKAFPTSEFKKLYAKRWRIEEFLKLYKNIIGLERLHSRSLNGVLQEIYLGLFKAAYLKGFEFLNRDLFPETDLIKTKINSVVSNYLITFDLTSMVKTQHHNFSFDYLRFQLKRCLLKFKKNRHYQRVTKRGRTKNTYRKTKLRVKKSEILKNALELAEDIKELRLLEDK